MLLDGGQLKTYKPGELLFKGGDPATWTLLVLTGKFRFF